MPALSLRRVTKRYGAVEAVAGVSLDVADGEFLVLLGPSGSGKSTILKLVAGIDVLDDGQIWIGEERVDRLLPRFRDVAMVFQSYALYPHLSVFSNLAFPLRSAGVGRAEARRRVGEVSTLLSLDGLLERRPGQLSGGQQQRVALGRAIVRQPKVFLLDEPLSNLDAKLRARTRSELVRLHERLRTTTVYVTHDQVEAMTMGHRVGVIEAGALRQVESPEVLYEYPADLVVADFLGSPPMNVVDVEVLREPEEVRLTGEGFDIAVTADRVPASIGRRAVLGIRAEYMRTASECAGGPTIRGAVESVELLGSERLVWVVAGKARLGVRVPASVRPALGERVAVALDPAGLRFFDAETGRLRRL